MRASQYFIATQREVPAEAEVISHQLMLRAGMIRKLASGLYNWLPTGLRVLQKVEQIVREEMDRSGALEVLMPVVQPTELWDESQRLQQYGPELLRIKDRHERPFCLGPTHEEVITDLVRNNIHSYKQLPVNFYQIQTKFRDEIRPRFGVMRAREFLMKDAYSFHTSKESLADTYDLMYQTYSRIFDRIGLDYRAVQADTGSIGGSSSHEFHVLAESGEDDIAFNTDGSYAANVELAEAVAPDQQRAEPAAELTKVETPQQKSIEQVAGFLKVNANQVVKTLIVAGANHDENPSDLVALVLRGDHELNDVKAEKLPAVAEPLTFASDEAIRKAIGAGAGSIGPCGLKIPVYVDRSAAVLSDFICGANEDDAHFTGANWERDAQITEIVDLRNVLAGDPSPDGNGTLEIKRGIEVGHIFQLGTKYSEAMNATVLDENGKSVVMPMGCYGIGVSRIVAAAVEQNHDDDGIIWPDAIAPFQIGIVAMNMHKSEAVKTCAESLYQELLDLGVDVLLDDRNERPGVKFADMELMGVPHRVVVGDRGLKNNSLEYKGRRDENNTDVEKDNIIDFIKQKLKLS